MATYSVIAQDGQMYGPTDESGMVSWIREGRVNRQTLLHCHETNARSEAWAVPALQPALGLSPQEVAQLLQAAQMQAAAQAPSPGAPAPGAAPIQMNYSGVVDNGTDRPRLTEFPVAAAVLLSIFVPLFAVIYYGIVHGNLPRRRPDDPGTGKAIGFMFIPFFNIFWMCFFWIRLCTRLNDERTRIGLPPTAPRQLVIGICWCYLGCFIPFINILAMLTIAVMAIIAVNHIQTGINELARATQPSYK